MIASPFFLIMNFTGFSRSLKADHLNAVRNEEEKLATPTVGRSAALS
jgi:hypothetical protein